MSGALDRILRSLRRDSGAPLSSLLRKGAGYLAARSAAPLWLRGCTRIGARCRTAGRPRVENSGTIVLGDDVILSSSLGPVELIAEPGGRIEIGDDVFVNFGTRMRARGIIRVGRDVAIGPYCTIGDPGDGGAPGDVEIGDGAWLGARVTLLPGARVGRGATITAGSVLAGPVPAGAVGGGRPVRILRLAEGEGRQR